MIPLTPPLLLKIKQEQKTEEKENYNNNKNKWKTFIALLNLKETH